MIYEYSIIFHKTEMTTWWMYPLLWFLKRKGKYTGAIHTSLLITVTDETSPRYLSRTWSPNGLEQYALSDVERTFHSGFLICIDTGERFDRMMSMRHRRITAWELLKAGLGFHSDTCAGLVCEALCIYPYPISGDLWNHLMKMNFPQIFPSRNQYGLSWWVTSL